MLQGWKAGRTLPLPPRLSGNTKKASIEIPFWGFMVHEGLKHCPYAVVHLAADQKVRDDAFVHLGHAFSSLELQKALKEKDDSQAS